MSTVCCFRQLNSSLDAHKIQSIEYLTLSIRESTMEKCNVVLTFESVDKILWCDHSNETSSAVLLHGIHIFSIHTVEPRCFELGYFKFPVIRDC